MKIQFYNSLTNQIDEFQPIEPGVVRLYSCGPTVYDFAHIGNFRSFLFGDVLRRFLEFAGNQVHHVMNITDVGHMTEGEEDRMLKAGERFKENKKSGRVPEGIEIEDPNDPYQIAKYYTQAFLDDARKLNYKIAFEYPGNVPHATDYVQGMIRMITTLIDRGHAYVAEDGVVYYSVESFPKYGTLSGNTLEALQSGAGGRVSDDDQANKKHPSDFMLWKPDDKHIMKWDSPWGTGYPGWHIECSVMARDLLQADVIDIHTGGEDLIFPHHECEIAQSCGATGQQHFANFWIHARFLMVNGEKMSKSKGNFFTARDIFEGKFTSGRKVHQSVLRFELIKSHYRANMNFTNDGMADSAKTVQKFMEFEQGLVEKTGGKAAEVDLSHPILEKFANALADDLNMSEALAVVIPWSRSNPSDEQEALAVWRKINEVLGIESLVSSESGEADSGDTDSEFAEVQGFVDQMTAALNEKDFGASDEARAKILEAGFEVQQKKNGDGTYSVTVKKPLA